MPEEVVAKEVVQETEDFNTKADQFFAEQGKDTPSEPTSEKKPEAVETKTEEPAGAEPEKTEQVKQVEEDTSLSVEDKLAKVTEILGDDLEAIDKYVKEKGYHTDPAWKAQRAIIDKLKNAPVSEISQEDRALIEDVKSVTNSRAYIQASGESQGLKQEKINENLKGAGYEVDSKEIDTLELVAKGLGTTVDALEKEGTKDAAQSIAKIARIVANQIIDKKLPSVVEPLSKDIKEVTQQSRGRELARNMEDTVRKDADLDWEKEVKPVVSKYITDNPEAKQEQIAEFFNQEYPRLVIQKLKGGKLAEVRTEKKGNLRQTKSNSSVNTGKDLKRTGDFNKDADAYFASIGMSE